MYINDLIDKLKDLKKKYGNCDVLIERMDYYRDPDDAEDITEFEFIDRSYSDIYESFIIICTKGLVE